MFTDFINLSSIYARFASGDIKIMPQEMVYIKELVNYCIQSQAIPADKITDIQNVVRICNVVYNNQANGIPVIDDDSYDKIIVLMRKSNIDVPVGSLPVQLDDVKMQKTSQNDKALLDTQGRLVIAQKVPNFKNMLFWNSLTTNITPPMNEDYIRDTTVVSQVKKRVREVPHAYDMCGTLDKAKYVLNYDAQCAGAYVDRTVNILERDFFEANIRSGNINPNFLNVLVSLKYDGVSIEATIVDDKIVRACSRGDTGANKATDYTEVFEGYTFPRATQAGLKTNGEIGIKFEAILTLDAYKVLRDEYGKNYANLRNGVAGLLNGLDARRFRDFLTLVPLESSLTVDRISEVEFLNKYYSRGIDFRCEYFAGTYAEVLFKIKKYVEEAESLREYMKFIYDGVVVELVNPVIRQKLGKHGSIPNYAIAVKFNPMKRVTTFLYYKYSVGQDGIITPIAYFDQVEFFGGVHDHASAHSYERFKQLNLRPGDKVILTYVNDVMPYLTKAPDSMQVPNNNPPIPFPTTCPSCGSPLGVSDSEKSAVCINLACPSRSKARLTNCLAKLGVKDISEETVSDLVDTFHITKLKDFYDVIERKEELIKLVGPAKALSLSLQLKAIQNECNYFDYQYIGALGFDNLAVKTWKIIMEQFSFDRLVHAIADRSELDHLTAIHGIGPISVDTIREELNFFAEDIKFIYGTFKYQKSKWNGGKKQMAIRFSGIRDANLVNKLTEMGYDADPDSSVTKDTVMLIVPYVGFSSGKVSKAFKYISNNLSAVTRMPKMDITWQNVYTLPAQVAPQVVDINTAYQMFGLERL